jgi:ribonuclease P protein component
MRKGRKVHTPNLIVFAASGDRDEPRLGLAVGRRVGKAACRNRWKRLVREVFRLRLQHRLPPIDLVVAVRAAEGRARPAPGRPATKQRPGTPVERRLAPGYAAVETELVDAVRRLGALGPEPG